MAVNMAAVAAMLQNMKLPNINPEIVILPKPPALTGTLAKNDYLSKATKYVHNMLTGPESMVVRNRYIYTGLHDGWIVEVIPPPPYGNGPRVRKILRMSTPECETRPHDESACGRPLGMRADKHGYLVVTDAYKGIFRINPKNGRYKQLFNTANKVKGQTIGFINDLTIADDGIIIFTSSSQKYNRTQFIDLVLEAETTGKVLVYNPRLSPPNQVQELVSNLGFPNGIELAADNSYVLIAEASRAKIHRVWIGANTVKRGRMEVFADNLPGFIDNIRRSPRGTYWVGISSMRSAERPSVLDRFGDKPMMRRGILGLPREHLRRQGPSWGMVIEMNEDGQIIRSLHDPEGKVFSGVSEVQEEDGLLYFGSFDRPYIGILNETSLPRPKLPTSEATAPATGHNGGTPGTNPNDNGAPGSPADSGSTVQRVGSVVRTPQIMAFLQRVLINAMLMDGQQRTETIVALVKRLIDYATEIRKLNERTNQLEDTLRVLLQIPGIGPGPGPGTGTGAAAGAGTGTQIETTPRTVAGTTSGTGSGAPSSGSTTGTSSSTSISPVAGSGATTAANAGPPSTPSPAADATTAQSQAQTTANAPTAAGTTEGLNTTVADTEGLNTTVADTEGLNTTVADTEGLNTTVADTEGLNTTVADTEGLNTTVAATEGLNTTVAATEGLNTTVADTEGLNTTVAATEGPNTTVAPTAGTATTVAATEGSDTTVAPTASADARTTTPAPIPPAVTTTAGGGATTTANGNPEGTSIAQTSSPTTTALATEAYLLATSTIDPEL